MWPTPQDYNETVQNPHLCFADSDLRKGTIETNAIGLPKAASGAFASVYKITTPTATWAVRCFLTERRDQKDRYKLISDYVLFDNLACTIDFHYLEEGIKVGGQWYPLVKMPWVDGPTLDVYLQNISNDRAKILELRDAFHKLSTELEEAGIAHGDLQHGNIIVSPDGLRLVDYDALFVPALAGRLNPEYGHVNYQHPLRDEYHFDTTVDNFSSWLIYTSLTALSLDPNLFDKYLGGDDCILFKRADLMAPETSALMNELCNHSEPEIKLLSNRLKRMLWLPPHVVPALDATEEQLNNLPTEKPNSWELVSTRQPDEWEAELRALSNQQSAAENKTVAKKAQKTGAKKSARTFFDNVLKVASPGLWVSMKTNEAYRFVDNGEYENALNRFQKVYELVQLAYPNDKNLELGALLKLANCCLLAGSYNQFENYTLVAAQLTSANAKLLEDKYAKQSKEPNLLQFHSELSKLLFAIVRKIDPEETLAIIRELMRIGGALSTTYEAHKIMTDMFVLLAELASTSRLIGTPEKWKITSNSLLRYQVMWIRSNRFFPINDYEIAWKSQIKCISKFVELSGDRQLEMKASLLARTLPHSMEHSSEYIDTCFAEPDVLKGAITELIDEVDMPLAIKGLMPSLDYLVFADARKRIELADKLWRILLQIDTVPMSKRLLYLHELDSVMRAQCLDDAATKTILAAVKIEFAFPARFENISAIVKVTNQFGRAGEKVSFAILHKMIRLVLANQSQLKQKDFDKAKQIIFDYAPFYYEDGKAGVLVELANQIPSS